MFYIKYLNLFFAIVRFILMFYFISMLFYLPIMSNEFLKVIYQLIYCLLILPLFTIINLIDIIIGIFSRNFKINKNVKNIFDCIGFVCSGFCCTKNVTVIKYNNLFFSLITLSLSILFLYYFLNDNITTKENLLDYSDWMKRVFIKIILHFIVSLLLFCHSYFFYYYEYILKRGNIYIEFYKRLIIKNRNKEARSRIDKK